MVNHHFKMLKNVHLLFGPYCRYCLVVALGYLSFCQITRVYVFDYGMYSADFTGYVYMNTESLTL